VTISVHFQQNIHFDWFTFSLWSHVLISEHFQLNIHLDCITFSLWSPVPISVHYQLNNHLDFITFSLRSHVPISVHFQQNIHLDSLTFSLWSHVPISVHFQTFTLFVSHSHSDLMCPYLCTSKLSPYLYHIPTPISCAHICALPNIHLICITFPLRSQVPISVHFQTFTLIVSHSYSDLMCPYLCTSN